MRGDSVVDLVSNTELRLRQLAASSSKRSNGVRGYDNVVVVDVVVDLVSNTGAASSSKRSAECAVTAREHSPLFLSIFREASHFLRHDFAAYFNRRAELDAR